MCDDVLQCCFLFSFVNLCGEPPTQSLRAQGFTVKQLSALPALALRFVNDCFLLQCVAVCYRVLQCGAFLESVLSLTHARTSNPESSAPHTQERRLRCELFYTRTYIQL